MSRYRNEHNFYVLQMTKTVDGELFSGKYARQVWKDGETITPLTYQDARRASRVRGFKMIPWEESKVYQAEIEDKAAEMVESNTSVFETIKETLGVETRKPTQTKRTRKRTTKK